MAPRLTASTLVLAVVLAAAETDPAPVCAETTPSGPIRVFVGPLHVMMTVERMMGKNLENIVLANGSDDFFCISARELDPVYQHMRLIGPRGERIQLTSYGESSRTADLGFDYGDGYLFIRPRERRRVSIDLGVFEMRGNGRYTYSALYLYYRCRDVVDRARIGARRQIKTFAVQARGSILWTVEK